MAKNTLAAIRIKQEMKDKSLSAAKLAELANLSYYTVENILSGKSSKIEKLEAIAKALGKPLMYLIEVNYDTQNIQDNYTSYDGELHYKTVKTINEICKKNKIHLTKNKMDKLINLIYPRLKPTDSDEFILIQTEAIINYAVRNII